MRRFCNCLTLFELPIMGNKPSGGRSAPSPQPVNNDKNSSSSPISSSPLVETMASVEESSPSLPPVTAIVIGAGHRGYGYAHYALCHQEPQLNIVAVADPDDHNRNRACEKFGIPPEMAFKSWEDLKDRERLADLAIICTQDRMHKDPAIMAAQKGYNILLEKPMAVTLEDCQAIVDAVKRAGVMFGVCHVLRYFPGFRLLKQLIDEGAIGKVCHISHTEPVGFWHYAHSYVRGNWKKESESSSSLLAKCCHDIDLVAQWMGDAKCTSISSFGSLMHFGPEGKPEGAADRCLDCKVHEQCPYSAQKIYLNGNRGWPTSAVVPDTADIEDLYSALRTGNYGKCVYSSDNDVMSNQVVNMRFDSGATANLTMVAFTKKLCARETVIYGTHGELRYNFSGPVKLYTFNDKKSKEIQPENSAPAGPLSGHGGADYYMINSFIDAIRNQDQSLILAGPEASLYSHELVFRAEESRVSNAVINM